MDTLRSNLRYAARRLLRSPLFTAVAVVSLGLGIGANTAIFSMVDAVIFRDLPYEAPDELVDVYFADEGFSHGTLSYPDFVDLREGSEGTFEDVAGMQFALVQVDADQGVEVLTAEAVSGTYFDLLGVRPHLGRLLGPDDDVSPGAHPVAVLGHGHWETAFGADPSVVGSEIRLGGRPYTIVGVAPPSYRGSVTGLEPHLYVPLLMYEELQPGAGIFEERRNHSLFGKARLADGVTMARAESFTGTLASDLRRDYPDAWQSDNAFVLVPTADVIMNPMIDRVLLPAAGMLTVVVGLVLLIACANLASFLLARASDRRKEVAVRLALGARRSSLIGQLMTEAVLLSLLGGITGVGVATWSLGLLVRADLPLPLPITLDLSLDGTVLAFALLVSLAAGVLFGLAPALQATRPDVAPTLRDESGSGGRSRGGAIRGLLVAGQMAVSVVLLVAGGLFLRSLAASSRIDPGFGNDPAGILQIVVPPSRYDEDEALLFVEELERRIMELPGVRAVGLTSNLHLNSLSTSTSHVLVDGVEPPPGQDYHSIDYAAIDAGFLDAAGIQLLAGRSFDDRDEPEGPDVVIVNQAFVDRFFPGQDPLGRTVDVNGVDTEIVGVAATARIRSLGEQPRPFLYANHEQRFTRFMTIVARTDADAGATAVSMMAAARALDPEIMVAQSQTMERHLAIMLLPRQLGALVLSGFAALALLLACIGLYGTVSYAVSRRVREVGIRLSLGAQSTSVVLTLMRDGLRLVGIGGVVGLLAAALASRLLGRLLYGVPALDPVTFVGVPLLLGAVATLAAWMPARRASRVSPVQALKSD